jgi:FdhD protein
LPKPLLRVPRSIWRASGVTEGVRAIPEEMAIAFTFNTATYAVMMATPQDLEDFAVGFSQTEGVISSIDDIDSVHIVEEEIGIELRIWLKTREAAEFLRRRRKMQTLNHETRAVHAAGFYEPNRGLVALGEDVGRHNTLDKLAGALARGDVSTRQGLVVLTSRISIEMVQKAAMIGAPTVAAVSAPTATCRAHGRGRRHDADRNCAHRLVRYRRCEILGLVNVEKRIDLFATDIRFADAPSIVGPGADLAHTSAKGVPLVRCHRNRPEPYDPGARRSSSGRYVVLAKRFFATVSRLTRSRGRNGVSVGTVTTIQISSLCPAYHSRPATAPRAV